MEALAEWVWCSFRPGEEITDEIRVREGRKIMSRCDLNKDGVIDEEVSLTLTLTLTLARAQS